MRTLKEIIQSIHRRLGEFVGLGQDLKDIRDGNYAEAMQKLGSHANSDYRDIMQELLGYPTLTEFWKCEFNLSQQRVSELILASEAVAKLRLNTAIAVPISESQVRELRKAPENQRDEIWKESLAVARKAGRAQPTAKEIAEVVSATKRANELNRELTENVILEPIYNQKFERWFQKETADKTELQKQRILKGIVAFIEQRMLPEIEEKIVQGSPFKVVAI